MKSSQPETEFHCTQPFIVIQTSSWYDWNTVKKDVKSLRRQLNHTIIANPRPRQACSSILSDFMVFGVPRFKMAQRSSRSVLGRSLIRLNVFFIFKRHVYPFTNQSALHTTFNQHRINVDLTQWHGINVDLMLSQCCVLPVKGRFLEFRMYHNFANLFSKLPESTFCKKISKFQ